MMTNHNSIIHCIKWITVAVLSLVFLAIILFLLIQTEPGKRRLSSYIEAKVGSSTGIRLELGSLTGWIPFETRLDHVILSDAEGEWFRVDGLRVYLSPWDLLEGRMRFHEIAFAEARLSRYPVTGGKEGSPPEDSDGSFTLPRLDIERLTVESFILEEPSVGSRVALTLSGMYLNASPQDASQLLFNLKRTDQETLELDIEAKFDTGEPGIRLYTRINEGEDGLIGRLLELPREGVLNIALDGKGTGSRWDGRLKAMKGNLSLIDSDLDLHIGEEVALSGSGSMKTLPALLPAGFGATPDTTVRFIFAGRFLSVDQVARIDSLRLHHVELGTVRLAGEYEFKTSALLVDASFESERTDGWASILGVRAVGQLTAQAHLSGNSLSPRGTLSLDVEGITDDLVQIGAFSLDLNISMLDSMGDYSAGVMLFGEGFVAGLHDGNGQPIPEKRLDCMFSVTMLHGQPVEVSKLMIHGEHTVIDLTGWFDPSGMGSLEASVEVAAIERLWPSIEEHVSGAVLGRVSARGDISALSATVQIDGPGIGFEGSGAVKILDREFDSNFRCTLPRLSDLSGQPDGPLDGLVTVEGSIGGSFDAADGRFDLKGSSIRVGRWEISSVDGRIDIRDLFDQTSGDLFLRIGEESQVVQSRSDFQVANGHLALSNITVDGLHSRLSGFLDIDLESGLIEGEIKGETKDLTLCGQILKEEIGGKAGVEARFSAVSGKQNAEVSMIAEKLGTRFGTVEALSMKADMENLRDEPSGTIKTGLEDVTAGELVFSSVSFDAMGDLQQMVFDGSVIGSFKKPFSMETKGRLEYRDSGIEIEAEHLVGMFGEERIALQSPLVFESDVTAYSIRQFAVAIGTGLLEVEGIVSSDTVDIAGEIRNVPMSALDILGVPNFQGSIGGAVHVDGKPDDPRVESSLYVDGLKVRDPALSELAPSKLILEAQLHDQGLNVFIDLSQPEERNIRGTLSLPMVLSLHPFAYSISPEGRLDGRLEGDFDLGRIAPLFTPDDQRVAGRIRGDVTLTGPISEPIVSGRLLFSEGLYENLTSGTILRGIDIEAVTEGRRFEIRRFGAMDGRKGRIAGSGWIDLDESRDFPFELGLEVVDARLVHQDAMTAVLDGRLTGAGTIAEIQLTGNLTARHVDILIPEKLSSQIPTLNEIEIGYVEGMEETVGDTKSNGPSRIDLDLTIDLPGAVFVRGRGLDSEWKGEIFITGELREPVINGNLSAVRGRYIFFDKRFVLNEGNILFFGTVPSNPNIDVKAETRTGDLTVNLLVTGRSSNLMISLESAPPLPSDELLARLLFGRSLSNITPIQALQLAQAVRTISGGGGTLDFMSRTRRLLSLDELEVRQEEEGSGTSIGVGKYVSEEVFIKVERNLASEESRVMVEVGLTPSLNLESDVGTDSRRGVGLNWKHDY
jgi:translocation and assembly module TamB